MAVFCLCVFVILCVCVMSLLLFLALFYSFLSITNKTTAWLCTINMMFNFCKHSLSLTVEGVQTSKQSKLCLRSARWLQGVHVQLCCLVCRGDAPNSQVVVTLLETTEQ